MMRWGEGRGPRDMAGIEARFVRLRAAPPATRAAFRAALACVASPGPASPVLRNTRRAGTAVLDAAERLVAAGGEHPYHNRHHVAETMLAAGWLGALARADGSVTETEAVLAVLAMAGHDLGHDGSRCHDGSLEAASAAATHAIGRDAGLDPAACRLVDRMILDTVPDGMPGGARHGGTAAGPDDPLRLLVREADVFASLLPRLGWRLTLALRREWRLRDDPAAAAVATFSGRHGFLAGFQPHSAAAVRIGLAATASRQLRAFEIVAARLGTGPGAAAGAAALDRLRRLEAVRAYRAALDAAAAEWRDGGPSGPG